MTETTLTEVPETLSACKYQAKAQAKLAAAWAEAADRFPHHAQAAKTFAAKAQDAEKTARNAATTAAKLAPTPERARSEQAQRALADAVRTREYAEQAARSAEHATASAKAARRFVPQRGDLDALCLRSQQAVFAWVSCPADNPVKLAVLRLQMEEALAAVQASLPLPATA